MSELGLLGLLILILVYSITLLRRFAPSEKYRNLRTDAWLTLVAYMETGRKESAICASLFDR
jgi:hypothetical protein